MEIDFRPASEEVYTITHHSKEKLNGEMWLGKGASGPPLHIHQGIEEKLTLKSGKLKIYRNGGWEVITAGAEWVIPAGDVHTFTGVEDSEAVIKFEISPDNGFLDFLKDTEKLVKEGRLTSYDNFDGIIYSSMLVKKYNRAFCAAVLPMKVMISIANGIGKLMGRKV